MPETTPLIKAALNLRVGAGFDVYVEVVVKSWTNDILFSTSKGEVYIKTEGGKKKLDAYGIQEELRGRLNGF